MWPCCTARISCRRPHPFLLAKAKELGSKEIFQHLHLQSGVPYHRTLLSTMTALMFTQVWFSCNLCYNPTLISWPVATDDTPLWDLQAPATIVVWPKSTTPGSSLTPSPVMDALSRKTAELEKSRSQLMAAVLIEEDCQLKQQQKSRGNYPNPTLHSCLIIFQGRSPLLYPMLSMKVIRRWRRSYAG